MGEGRWQKCSNSYFHYFNCVVSLGLDLAHFWRHDTQRNDILHNDIEHNNIQHNDIRHNNTHDAQHKLHSAYQQYHYAGRYDIQHKDSQYNDTQHTKP